MSANLFLLLLALALFFILVSKLVSDSTVRLVLQVVIAAGILYVLFRAVGLFA